MVAMASLALRVRVSIAILSVSFALAALMLGQDAYAAGLVPQCGSGQFDQAIYCQLCHLFELFNNVIQYAILIAAAIAGALFATAGVLFYTANGNQAQLDKGKKLFKDVFIGYLVALCAVLFVQTIVNSVAQGKLTWRTVQCQNERVLVGGIRFQAGPTTVCQGSPEGCLETTNPEYSPVISYGGCSQSEMESKFPGNGAIMSCVCARESTGGNVGSGIDVMWNVPMSEMPQQLRDQLQSSGALRFSSSGYVPFSWGVFQINLAAHNITCNGRTLNCTQAFSNRDTGMRDWSSFIRGGVSADVTRVSPQASGALGYGKVVTNWNLFGSCVNAALDRSCNLEYASRVASQAGLAGPWSTSYTACKAQVESRR